LVSQPGIIVVGPDGYPFLPHRRPIKLGCTGGSAGANDDPVREALGGHCSCLWPLDDENPRRGLGCEGVETKECPWCWLENPHPRLCWQASAGYWARFFAIRAFETNLTAAEETTVSVAFHPDVGRLAEFGVREALDVRKWHAARDRANDLEPPSQYLIGKVQKICVAGGAKVWHFI
jgi:hypothetical protein